MAKLLPIIIFSLFIVNQSQASVENEFLDSLGKIEQINQAQNGFVSPLEVEKSPSSSKFNLFKFFAENRLLSKESIHFLLFLRCKAFLAFYHEPICSTTAYRMLEMMDFAIKVNPKAPSPLEKDSQDYWRSQGFTFISFKTEFIKILNDPHTTIYLESLVDKLAKVAQGNKLVGWNFFTFHVKELGMSQNEAIKYIAVLFQDISKVTLHLRYFAKDLDSRPKEFQTNLFLLRDAISFVQSVKVFNPDLFASTFYPPSVSTQLNNNFYHFYVPAYLFNSLKEIKSSFYSSMGPLLLTLTYEIITLKDDQSYVLASPQKLISPEHDYKMRDIYASYLGTQFAKNEYWKRVDFPIVQEAFGESIFKAFNLMLKN